MASVLAQVLALELQHVQAGLRMKQEYIQKAQADMAQATVRVQQLQVEASASTDRFMRYDDRVSAPL